MKVSQSKDSYRNKQCFQSQWNRTFFVARKMRSYETWTHLFRPDPFINAAPKPVWAQKPAEAWLREWGGPTKFLAYYCMFCHEMCNCRFRSHSQLICNDLLQNRRQKQHVEKLKGWCTTLNLKNTQNILVSPWQHAKNNHKCTLNNQNTTTTT